MALRRRLLMYVAVYIAIAFPLILSINHIIINQNYIKNAESYAESKITSLEVLFEVQLEELERICKDWAIWDDTYEFMETRDERYIQSNLPEETLENLDLTAMIFVKNGSIFLCKLYRANRFQL